MQKSALQQRLVDALVATGRGTVVPSPDDFKRRLLEETEQ